MRLTNDLPVVYTPEIIDMIEYIKGNYIPVDHKTVISS